MLTHSGPIAGIATHGNWVATAGYDNRLILWSANTQTSVAMGMHDHLVNHCAFSHDGQFLVSASSDYSARVWSLPSMRLMAVLADHQDDVDMAVFSPDDQFIATCALDRIVRLYDRAGQCLKEFKGHTGNILALAWSSDGRSLVSTSVDGTIRCWDVSSGHALSCSHLDVRTDSLDIASDGTIYAGDDWGRIAILRDKVITFHAAHQAGIKKVVYQESSQQLVCLSYDGWMSVWNVSGASPVELSRSRLPDCIWARSAAMTDDGKVVAATFGTTYATYDPAKDAWDLQGVQAGKAINAIHHAHGHTYTIGDAGDLLQDGQHVASVGSLCNFLVSSQERLFTGGQLGALFDAFTGEVLYQHHSPLNCGASYTQNGQAHLVLGTYTGELLVLAISGKSAKLVQSLKVYENAVKGVSIEQDRVFSVCANTTIAWHDLNTWQQLRSRAAAHEKIVNDCCSIDVDHFATISRDRTLKIWNGKDHESFQSPHPNSIKCISINPDKSKLATGSYGGTVAVFDLSRRQWTRFDRPTTAGISDIAWDPEHDQFLASSYDGQVYPIHGR